jgi:hypothetical protein
MYYRDYDKRPCQVHGLYRLEKVPITFAHPKIERPQTAPSQISR